MAEETSGGGMSEIPIGLCQCGCGLKTALSPRNDATLGYVKGRPFRFLPSHNRRARPEANIYTSERTAGGWRHEHVAVAEKALGRRLPDGAQVHHVDEDRRNSANRNLVICQDQAFHHLLHVRARVVRAGGDPNTQRFCAVCASVKPFADFNVGQSQCRSCQSSYFREYRERKAKEMVNA